MRKCLQRGLIAASVVIGLIGAAASPAEASPCGYGERVIGKVPTGQWVCQNIKTGAIRLGG